MRFNGFIPIPIFLTPYSPIPNAFVQGVPVLDFEKQGFTPRIQGTGSTYSAGGITSMNVCTPNISGYANLALTGSGNAVQGFEVGGFESYYVFNNSEGSFFSSPRLPGPYVATNVKNFITPVLATIGPTIVQGVIPGQIAASYQPLPAIQFAGPSPSGEMFQYVVDGNILVHEDAWRWGGLTSSGTWAGVGICVQVPAPSGLTWVFLQRDTNSNHPSAVFPYLPQAYTGSPPDISSSAFVPDFGNDLMNALLQGFANTYDVYSWYGGFVVVFQTNGAGPTGQQCEIAVMDFAWSNYWLIKLEPQEARGIAAVKDTGVRWRCKIDTNGVFYWNSGHVNDVTYVWYSYSPIPWEYSQFAYQPGPPISLPCYTPCNPV